MFAARCLMWLVMKVCLDVRRSIVVDSAGQKVHFRGWQGGCGICRRGRKVDLANDDTHKQRKWSE